MSTTDRNKLLALVIAVIVISVVLGFAVRQMAIRSIPPPIAVPPVSTPTTTTAVPPVALSSDLSDETGSIHVLNVRPNERLPNGFVVKGTAVAFESQFSWRLLDGTGAVLGSGYSMARQPDAGIPGPYAFPALYDRVPETPTGTLMVYEASAKDGSDIHVVRIPVQLSTATTTVSVYFGNTKKNPNMIDCGLVFPVTRTVADGVMPFIAVQALLGGPTMKEKAAGYLTSIPDGVRITGAGDPTGALMIGFTDSLDQGVAGSCRVSAIRAQIEQTATQGGALSAMPISIGGRTQDILQP